MKRIDKKEQIRKYSHLIWQGVNVELCNNCTGYSYCICAMHEKGWATKELTPAYKTPAELLAYLQGVYAVRTNNWD